MSDLNRPTVTLTHRVHEEILRWLETHFTVIANQTGETLAEDEFRMRLRSADGVMSFMPDRITAELLDASPRLKVIAGAFKGHDNIDVAACTERGIWVTCVDDLLSKPTAELAIGLLIALGRNIPAGDRQVRIQHHGWKPSLYGSSIVDSTVGVVGAGRLGQALIQLLSGFTDSVLCYDPHAPAPNGARPTDLPTLLQLSDSVIVCAPLNSATLHLIGHAELSRMREGALLINVSRGSVVDERAVAQALQSGHLGGYAADVFEFEDQSRDDRPPNIAPELLSSPRDRTLFTPHLGSAVTAVRLAIEKHAATSLIQALAGQVPAGAINKPSSLGRATIPAS